MKSDQRRLNDYSKNMVQQHVFPGLDAAVAFVPEGQVPSPELQSALNKAGRQRWYPVSGGHLVKVEYHSAAGSEHLFQFEQAGWDHEECEFCSQSVRAGQKCWTTPGAHFVVFCEECYEKLRTE
jgi:hypothetical protein